MKNIRGSFGVQIQTPGKAAKHRHTMSTGHKANNSLLTAIDDINFLFEAGKCWHTLLKIQAQCKHLNLFIGPPAAGKSTVMKYLLGDISKLTTVKIDRQFSIVETEDCFEHLDTYSTKAIQTIIVKGDELYVKCPDLHKINLVSSFFLERLLRISLSVRIVFVCDYATVTDRNNDYNVLWSSLEQVTKLMTSTETIENVGLIVTKTSGYSEDQETLNSLQTAWYELVCRRGSKTEDSYKKVLNVISCFAPQTGLFKTPVQTGPLDQSRLFCNNKVRAIFESIVRANTNNFSFVAGALKPKELRAMAERCHSATLKNLSLRIERFHNTRLLKCSKDTLNDVRILLVKTIDYMDKLYTGRKISEGVAQYLTHPIDDQQYQAFRKFFVVEIMDFHRVLMKFFKRDYDMTMQSIVYREVDKKMNQLLTLYPRYENALGFMETVGNVLSNEIYQTKRRLYNSKDLDDWGKVNINAQHGLSITLDNFRKFCEKISCNYNLEDLEEPFGLAYLNNIIVEKLHDPLQRFIDLGVERIRGKEVVLVFGKTGVGKTTMIQYLLGIKLRSTVAHATRYPEITKINDVYYVDCPSLEEVRKSENEIQTWITIKTILQISKAVKWLSVCEAGDLAIDGTQNLQKLLQSCVSFMRNFEKYSDGLGLIVTKIECRDFYCKHSPEGEIRRTLSQIAANCWHDTKISRLIKTLLESTSAKGSKIAYFFSLNSDPKLAQLFVHQKKQMEKMIDNLRFIPSDENDFDFALSNKSKLQIYSTLIGSHLETHFQDRVSLPSCDIFDVNDTMQSVFEALKAVRAEHLEFGDSCAAIVTQ